MITNDTEFLHQDLQEMKLLILGKAILRRSRFFVLVVWKSSGFTMTRFGVQTCFGAVIILKCRERIN